MSLHGPALPERASSGSSLRAMSSRRARPRVAGRVGMEVVGLDGQTRGIEAVIGVGHVDHLREARGPRRLQQTALVGRIALPPDARDQHPEDRHAALPAVSGHRPVDAGEDLPMSGPECALVMVGAADGLDPRLLQHRLVNGAIPAEPAPAGSAAAVRPSRRRPRSTRRSPGPDPSASRPG